MKKLTDVLNPFVLLLVPVLFAVIMGLNYQLHRQHEVLAGRIRITEQAVPLFYQGIHFVKALCSVSQQNVW